MKVINYFDSNRQKHWLEKIKSSDWSAGAFLHKLLSENTFFDAVGKGSRVLLLTDGDELISFCTFSEYDDVQPTDLTPWIGFVYTFPEHRGHRYAGLLFHEIERIAKDESISTVYLSTNHKGLYEKYGFAYKTELIDIEGKPTGVYVKRIKQTLETERLLLRRWRESDAEDLYNSAKDPEVGLPAGWPPHDSIEHSLEIIKNVFKSAECYAICLKEDKKAIGAIELMYNLRESDNAGECELGFWLAKPFWGRGIIPEAGREMLRRAFEDLGMKKVWCGYYDGNEKSKRVQQKLGFRYHHTKNNIPIVPLNETRIEHINCITRDEWKAMNNNIIIRLEKEEDYREVENLVRESFWNVYKPGCSEHYVIHRLHSDPAFIKELDFVMEKDGKIIGQNIFMKTVINSDDGRDIEVLTMGPICITPELKRQGYGKILLDYSLEKAAELGFGAVLFEGNIDFYGKSGFDYARNFDIRYHDLPEGADSSFFLCKDLISGYLDGISGVYQTPQGYCVDDVEVEEFDKNFPPKEKLKLPCQIFE